MAPILEILPIGDTQLDALCTELGYIREAARQAVEIERERALRIIAERIVRVRAGPRAEIGLVKVWEAIAGRPYDGPRWHGEAGQVPG